MRQLAIEVCPRCHSVGLAVPDTDRGINTPEANHYIETMTIQPSIVAWCPACHLRGNWPGMCWVAKAKP